jgi:hypothetical protein
VGSGENTTNRRYHSDMQEFDAKVYRQFAKKGSLGYGAGSGSRIRVHGRESPNGLSTHGLSNTYATVKYKLEKNARSFIASVALNDTAGTILTPQTFLALGDGKVLWKSKPVGRSGLLEDCRVDVRGIDVLELRVDCPGDFANTQAVWLEPHVLLK